MARFHNVFGSDAKIVREAPDGVNEAKNARIHIATYQSLGIHEDGDASFLRRHYPENHFSHILIDECHRSAWGTWSKVLTRNDAAFQIGLTATPRELTGSHDDQQISADNIKHFGEPVYDYSLAQGIEDGYLAPCEIKQGRVSIDETTLVKKEVIQHKAKRVDTGPKAKEHRSPRPLQCQGLRRQAADPRASVRHVRRPVPVPAGDRRTGTEDHRVLRFRCAR